MNGRARCELPVCHTNKLWRTGLTSVASIRDTHALMRSLTRGIRVLALVHLLLALPLMGGIAVCIPLDGTRQAEPGLCGCMLSPVAGAEASLDSADADACGSCRDVALSSFRGTGRSADLAPRVDFPRCAPVRRHADCCSARRPLRPVRRAPRNATPHPPLLSLRTLRS